MGLPMLLAQFTAITGEKFFSSWENRKTDSDDAAQRAQRSAGSLAAIVQNGGELWLSVRNES